MNWKFSDILKALYPEQSVKRLGKLPFDPANPLKGWPTAPLPSFMLPLPDLSDETIVRELGNLVGYNSHCTTEIEMALEEFAARNRLSRERVDSLLARTPELQELYPNWFDEET